MSTFLSAREINFQVFEHLNADSLTRYSHYGDHDISVFQQCLATAKQIAEEQFYPHNRQSDLDEPRLVNGKVEMIPAIGQAYQAFIEGGFMSASRPYEIGGMQLPHLVTQSCFAYFQAANIATSSYALLTFAAANMLENYGTDEQKEQFLKPMLEGQMTGTMALTEPDAGSSLADLTTEAIPQSDGTYRLRGQKIFISAGDHNITDNIVHLVLARIKGAPAGTKGISLFIVPKLRPGTNGEWLPNDVNLSGLFHKMGWRGTTSTSLNFGEQGDCHGYLIGEEHCGLKYMFNMMNEARVSVGLGASALACAGYYHSLSYSRERKQGRPPSGKPTDAPVALIEHADIRRMLLAQKVYAEGSLALCLYAARLDDDRAMTDEADKKQRLQSLLDLLTPIVKSWPAEYGIEANHLAIQVLGGYGYTREYPVEQYLRENRLNPIHEGTKGIQAIDLLGRKTLADQGKGLKILAATMQQDTERGLSHEVTKQGSQMLADYSRQIQEAVTGLFPAIEPEGLDKVLAHANRYLDTMGHLVVGWMWLRQALTAVEQLPTAKGQDHAFYQGKIASWQFYYEAELPKLNHLIPGLVHRPASFVEMSAEWF
jgi:butyryl-CoA dehydrogenase